jgi:hypothetical protein
MNKENSTLATLLVEYELTQKAAFYFDLIIWGSFIVCFLIEVFMFEKMQSLIFSHPFFISFPPLVLAAWYGFFLRHKKIQEMKFMRLHKIEEMTGMCQHFIVRIFDRQNKTKFINTEMLCLFLSLFVMVFYSIVIFVK